jgi:hypothetical protein
MDGATEKSTGGETRGPAQSPADHGGACRDRAARRHPWHQPVRIHAQPFPLLPPSRSLGRTAPRCRLAVALLRIGVNLNQIAYRMNKGMGAPPQLLALIARIEAILDQIYGPGDNGGRAQL